PASTFARLGLLYLRLEKADSAEASFQNALTVRPDLAIAHTGLGRVYMDLRKKPDKALPHFEKAVEIDTTDIDTHDRLIHTLLALEHTGGRARKIASKTIARFPDLSSPHLLLARAHNEDGSSHRATLYYYKNYLKRNPNDHETAYDFSFALYQAKEYRDLEDITSRMTDPRALPLLAQALIQRRDHEGALAAFLHYIKTLPEEEQPLFDDISYIGSKAEGRAYRLSSASDDKTQRERFLTRFWLQKDRFKTSGGALRRAEHYRRVWHARTHYGKKWPWDRRGEIYIRYGEPDYRSTSRDLNAIVPLDVQRIQEQRAYALYGDVGIEANFVGPVYPIRTLKDGGLGEVFQGDIGFSKFRPVTTTTGFTAVPWEVWIYKNLGNGAEFTFTDEFLGGNFDFAPVPSLTEEDLSRAEASGRSYMSVLQRLNEFNSATMAQSLAATEPEHYSIETLEPLNFYFDALTFKGPEGETELQVTFALPLDNIALPTDPDTTVVVERRTSLIYPRALDHQKTKHALAIDIKDSNRDRGLQALSGVSHIAPPGEYELAVEAWRQHSNRVGAYEQPNLELPDYHNKNRLMMSDVQVASRIVSATEAPDTSFVRGDLYIQPQPSATFIPGMSMYVYFEIYNLKRDEFGQTRYTISYEVQQRRDAGFSLIPLLAKLGKKNAEAVELSFEQVGTDPDENTYLEMPLTNLTPGRYNLRLTITDSNHEQSETKDAVFFIPNTRQ
ncbi:MAG: tetratricopeptide repeat protein, partial [Candidatus Latescibacteria bacterium]|nr:tetratricopeptide repeat protein [Candidatus Latescibacterota bacterium]